MKTRLQISFLQLTSNNKQAIITKIKCPSTVQRAKRGRIPLSSDGGQMTSKNREVYANAGEENKEKYV